MHDALLPRLWMPAIQSSGVVLLHSRHLLLSAIQPGRRRREAHTTLLFTQVRIVAQ